MVYLTDRHHKGTGVSSSKKVVLRRDSGSDCVNSTCRFLPLSRSRKNRIARNSARLNTTNYHPTSQPYLSHPQPKPHPTQPPQRLRAPRRPRRTHAPTPTPTPRRTVIRIHPPSKQRPRRIQQLTRRPHKRRLRPPNGRFIQPARHAAERHCRQTRCAREAAGRIKRRRDRRAAHLFRLPLHRLPRRHRALRKLLASVTPPYPLIIMTPKNP